MLPLHRQEHYRSRYSRMDAAWQPATAVYEQLVQHYLTAAALESGARLRVLDVGCGAGGVLERLASQIAWPYGIDSDRAALRRHRARLSLVAGTATALPFAPATFDLLLCAWVFEHLADPPAALAELARVLKPHGHLLFLTPHARHWLVRLNRCLPAIAHTRLVRAVYGRQAADIYPVSYRINTPAAISRIVSAVGLKPVGVRMIGDPTYLAFNTYGFGQVWCWNG